MLVDPREAMSVSKQCRILDIPRSSLYFVNAPPNKQDLFLTNKVDETYTQFPFYGTRRILTELQLQGINLGRDRIRTIMRRLGIEAIYPKKNLSKPAPNHKIFPYLLRGKIINKPNQVWSADITYVRLAEGFIYLFAIIDWYSRFVISWKLSSNLGVDFCIEALSEALELGKPEYFNVDQGSQFSTPQFFQPILDRGIKFSMDGRGRYLDNIFVERLWRTVKYENIFISGYSNLLEARAGLENYFDFYNIYRPHQSLENFTPLLKYCNEAH
jgi:putative transposase